MWVFSFVNPQRIYSAFLKDNKIHSLLTPSLFFSLFHLHLGYSPLPFICARIPYHYVCLSHCLVNCCSSTLLYLIYVAISIYYMYTLSPPFILHMCLCAYTVVSLYSSVADSSVLHYLFLFPFLFYVICFEHFGSPFSVRSYLPVPLVLRSHRFPFFS